MGAKRGSKAWEEMRFWRVIDAEYYVVFEGSNVVHHCTGSNIATDERCPNCGVHINGVLLGDDGKECWKDENSIWKDHAKNLRFIKKPTGTGKYRFCKKRGS